jgi:hypothetical protein
VSSIRRMKVPPWWRANAHGNSAERMLPRCRKPVGLGAKRVRTVQVSEVRYQVSDAPALDVGTWRATRCHC